MPEGRKERKGERAAERSENAARALSRREVAEGTGGGRGEKGMMAPAARQDQVLEGKEGESG